MVTFVRNQAMLLEMLASFTLIVYDRGVAQMAIDEEATIARIHVMAKIIKGPDSKEGEFPVLVSDAWQGKVALALTSCKNVW